MNKYTFSILRTILEVAGGGGGGGGGSGGCFVCGEDGHWANGKDHFFVHTVELPLTMML